MESKTRHQYDESLAEAEATADANRSDPWNGNGRPTSNVQSDGETSFRMTPTNPEFGPKF